GRFDFLPQNDWEFFDEVEIETAPGRWAKLKRNDEDDELLPTEFFLSRSTVRGVEIRVGTSVSGPVRVRIPRVRVGVRSGVSAELELDTVEADVDGLDSARQLVPLTGGRSAESTEEVARRTRVEWGLGFRAVTAADYERLLRGLDPLVQRVEVIPSEMRPAQIDVVVLPRAPVVPGRLGARRLRYLERTLSRHAPVGTILRVAEPAFVVLDVEILLDPEGVRDAGKETLVEDTVRAFFDPLSGGAEGRGVSVDGLSGESCGETIRRLAAKILRKDAVAQVRVSTPGASLPELGEESILAGALPVVESISWSVAATTEAESSADVTEERRNDETE
ncbi:MAG: baseplate J/gp47 family protein, partial [Planctomycetota bacterium]